MISYTFLQVNMAASCDFITLKILVVGDSGVGKTQIVNRYTEATFNPLHIPTIGKSLLFTNYYVHAYLLHSSTIFYKPEVCMWYFS